MILSIVDTFTSIISGGGVVLGLLVVSIAVIVAVMRIFNIYKVPASDEAFVITGMWSGKTTEVKERNPEYLPPEDRVEGRTYSDALKEEYITRKVKFAKTIIGGGGFVVPGLQKINMVWLKPTIIQLKHTDLISANKVLVDINATIYLRVPPEEQSVVIASQNFREMSSEGLSNFVKESLDGHLRGIVALKTPEEINENLEDIGKEVMRISQPDMEKLGLTIVSFVINRVENEEYFKHLATLREAVVERNAIIATAEASKESRMKVAEAEEFAKKRETEKDMKVAEFERNAEVMAQKMRKDEEVAKADGDLAHRLKTAEVNQKVMEQEMQVKVIEQEQQRIVEQKRAEAEGSYLVKRSEYDKQKKIIDAEAEKARIELQAEADKARDVRDGEAVAEVDKVKKQREGEGERLKDEERAKGIEAIGLAEAIAIEAKGKADGEAIRAKMLAEAEGIEQLMLAQNKMGDYAKQLELAKLTTNILPVYAEKIADGMGKMGEKVTYFQFGNGEKSGIGNTLFQDTLGFAGALPALLKNSAGIDISKIFGAVELDDGKKEATTQSDKKSDSKNLK